MTDTPPVPPTPDTPPTPPAASVPPAPPAAPGVAGPKQTLSQVGFIAGLVGFVFSWIPVLGFLVSLAAIIISLMAKGREPGAPKWMWIVGLIGGIVGLVVGLIYGISLILLAIASTSLGGVTQY
ncbi:MAG TPA: hypothetical protein VGO65_06605 [Pseudolysinimonas sp.]|nr:hypothetical protein [Pseudolysinimonas sp.]